MYVFWCHILLGRHLAISLFVFTFCQWFSCLHFWYWCSVWVHGSFSLLLTIPALSLKIKCNVLHVHNRDIKEASSIFWSRGITRTQENCCTVWGKDLYCRHQSGIRHKFVDSCLYTCVCSVSTLPYWSFCRSSHLFVNSLDKCFI